MKKYNSFFLIAILIAVLDQFSKWLVVKNIPLYSKLQLLSVLDLTNIRNPGIAFGLLKNMPDHIRFPFYVLVLVVAVIIIFVFLKKLNDDEKIIRYSLALILGGAIGNSIDRFRLGYVTDFINLHWFSSTTWNWPPFNISDSAITIGGILILIFGILLNKRKDYVYRNR